MQNIHLIGIAGGSASGKTTVLSHVLSTYSSSEVVLVSQDNYYKNRSEQAIDAQGVTNFDLPTAIDVDRFERDLLSLKGGNSISKLEYTFNNPTQKPKTIEILPARVVIVEGLFVFHFTTINAMFDSRVYIDCPPELRLARRIKRDAEERGYPESDVRYRWQHHVRPADQQFLEPYRASCDLVICNDNHQPLELAPLHNLIQNQLER